MWQAWTQSFISLFIVIDAIGNLPFVIALSEGMSKPERRRMINIAIITAVIVGLAFLFLGSFILKEMGISVGSFAIAGGIILLAFSIKYMMTGHMVDALKEEMVAVVPIGTPLTVGPATITTLLLLVHVNEFPLYIILLSFAINILITWILFLISQWIMSFLGQGGVKAVSRVTSLLLAAIAVSMVVNGLKLLGIIHLSS